MNPPGGVARDYERQLRRELAGLPRPDLDDVVEEVRSHLVDEIAEGRSPAEAVAAFGDPATVASEIVDRRLRPEGGSPVPEASRARRAAAWTADFLVGWGPLVVLPVWPMLVGWVQDRFLMSPEQVASLSATYGYERQTFPFALVGVALAFAAWGAWYWRGPRARSTSVGTRMAALARFRSRGERTTVRSADVAESEPARIVSRTKWYLALPLALFGAIVALAALEYTVLAIGSFDQPTGDSLEAAAEYEDFSRADGVVAAFYDAIVAGDVAAAQALAEKPLASQVASLVAETGALGIVRADRGMNVGPDSYVMHEFYGDGRPRRTVVLTLARHDEQRDAATFATVYRVSSIEVSATP